MKIRIGGGKGTGLEEVGRLPWLRGRGVRNEYNKDTENSRSVKVYLAGH